MTRGSKKPRVITRGRTSFSVFFIPILLVIYNIYTIISQHSVNVFNILFTLFVCLFVYFIFYHKKYLVVTENKVYFFFWGKFNGSVDLLVDFKEIHVQQSRFGLFFNFGRLEILDRENNIYSFLFLHNPLVIAKLIIDQHTRLVKGVDENYQPTVRNYLEEREQEKEDATDTPLKTNSGKPVDTID